MYIYRLRWGYIHLADVSWYPSSFNNNLKFKVKVVAISVTVCWKWMEEVHCMVFLSLFILSFSVLGQWLRVKSTIPVGWIIIMWLSISGCKTELKKSTCIYTCMYIVYYIPRLPITLLWIHIKTSKSQTYVMTILLVYSYSVSTVTFS